MNTLIQMIANEQGSFVVSARSLYDYLGFDNYKWSRWSTKNIVNNRFTYKGEDWQVTDGNPRKDYLLTIEFAKRLSILSQTEKGEEARMYFIEYEGKVRRQHLPTSEQLLHSLMAQSNQLQANQQRILEQLEALMGLHLVQANRIPVTGTSIPKKSTGLLSLVKQKVNDYCAYQQASQSETYSYFYKRLYEVYDINVYTLVRAKGESLLDALGRYGHLERLYTLVEAELNYVEE